MSDLHVNNLVKSFGDTKVLFDVSFKVKNGEFLSLLGPSGCGKTTILRIINGLEFPDGGSICIDEKNITALPAEKRNIGMVFQNYALFPSMNVRKNIAYGLKIRKKSEKEIKEKVDWALNIVKLEGYGDRKITKLSGGQQQRVALARALVIEPAILLLDEPLSALDRKIRAEMQIEIRNIQQKIGITTVFVTHDQEEALTMSDKIILMNKGVVEQNSDPWTMYNKPVSVFASDFLGKANILQGKITSVDADTYIEGSNWRLPINLKEGFSVGENINMAIRSEHFIISQNEQDNYNKFVIENKIFTGNVIKLIGKMGNDPIELTCLSMSAQNFECGQTLYIYADTENVLYYQ